jgi:hypothetical protein
MKLRRGRAATILVGIVATVWGVGCAGAKAQSPAPAVPTAMKTAGVPAKIGEAKIDIGGHALSDDDARAAGILAELMLHHPEEGFQVLTVGTDGVGVARGPFKFLIQPKIKGPGKTNKLVIKQFYMVRPEHAASAEKLQELCFELNTTMPFIHASILQTQRGPLFVAQSELSFGDTLMLGDLATYLDELKHEFLAQGAKRMAAYLK